MALSLAKVTIIVGAGVVGSVFAAKDRSLPDVPGLFYGAAKVVWNQFKSKDPAPAVKKLPHNDALMAQVEGNM